MDLSGLRADAQSALTLPSLEKIAQRLETIETRLHIRPSHSPPYSGTDSDESQDRRAHKRRREPAILESREQPSLARTLQQANNPIQEVNESLERLGVIGQAGQTAGLEPDAISTGILTARDAQSLFDLYGLSRFWLVCFHREGGQDPG